MIWKQLNPMLFLGIQAQQKELKCKDWTGKESKIVLYPLKTNKVKKKKNLKENTDLRLKIRAQTSLEF